MFPVRFEIEAQDGAARAGTATTARGTYTTPLFMPVGTRGAIKYLSAADYERLGAQIVLGNTYHLMLRPGADVVERFGGLAAFAGWDGITLTDSGGLKDTASVTVNQREFYLGGVRIAQPWYTFGRIRHAIDAAGAEVTAAVADE